MLAVYWFISLSPLISYLVPQGRIHRMMRLLANQWMGTLEYILLVVLVLDGIRHVYKHTKWGKRELKHPRRTLAAWGGVAVALVMGISIWGIIQAGELKVNRVEVQIQKEAPALEQEPLTVALVADLHLGYTIGLDHTRQVVEQLKLADPDLVVFAGDTFDNEYAALEDPQALAEMLREIPSRYGVYSCWGNHDVTERLLAGFSLGGEVSSQEDEKFREFFQQAGIQLLEDQAVLVEDAFYLVGRQDPQRQAKLGEGRLDPDQLLEGLDQDKPILVIDHQPGQLEELSQAGADLVLSGHTHNGQMFPGNLVVKLFWKNPAGVMQVGNMTSCVTQGAGVWGPAMRVGTQNEIMLITVKFAGAEK